MNSFRFGLWMGFVAGIVLAALWDNEPDWEFEPSTTPVQPPQDTIIAEDATSQFQAE